ncbi:protein kinase family protein [Pseudomonas borbori]
MTAEQERRQSQLAFIASGAELEIGRPTDCPLPLEQLAATQGDEAYVRERFSGGLTAHVYRIEADGRDWTLKRARERCLVQNPDGQTSFLNELQRRADLRQLKRDARLGKRLGAIVDTQYASLNRGILLSPWIAGDAVSEWNERQLLDLFDVLGALLLGGLFEWDLCPGNTLDDGRIRLFDFGYMYRFDPLRQFNSNGTATPQFHAAERFETRQYFAHLLRLEQHGDSLALAAFRLEKQIALLAYQRLHHELNSQGASSGVLDWLSAIMKDWCGALSGDLEGLYLREAWRSHNLDLHDDLSGQTCTPLTLQRIDWLERTAQRRYADLQRLAVFGDTSLSAATLVNEFAEARQLAQQWQIQNSP